MGKKLKLHNWRCFTTSEFALPDHSFLILDENGSGKTSILSALYLIFSKKSWPSTKTISHLKNGQQYFGLEFLPEQLRVNTEVAPSGRLRTKFDLPQTGFSWGDVWAKGGYNSSSWPVVLTYQPSDNFWFSQSRSIRLGGLDSLLEICYADYKGLLNSLSQNLRSKTQTLRNCIKKDIKADMTLIEVYSQNIYNISKQIWKIRAEFLDFVQQNLDRFETWILSPIDNWKIIWETVNAEGYKDSQKNLKKPEYPIKSEPNWSSLWQKELLAGKLLFGAQRDNFDISSHHISVAQALSRGEMRLLVIFLKSLVLNFIQERQVIWLVDDIFNELDTKREDIMFQKILQGSDLFIATGTKSLQVDLPSFSLDYLKKSYLD